MQRNETEAMEFLEENDVKFIQLTFCDIYGIMKNVSIMTPDLHRAVEDGISFDASAISGFASVDDSDLYLRPVLSTLALIPWRPPQGRIARIYCEIDRPGGEPFELDSRRILSRSVRHAVDAGLSISIGAECEFYLFRLDEEGKPTMIPADHAGYMDVAPEDCGETVRRDICLALEQMNFRPETSHHEEGPGQNEIDFRFSDAMTSADNVLTFRSVVETVAAANGYAASFRPKPLPDCSGNGFHINLSPRKWLAEEPDPELKRYFVAGILDHIGEMTAFLNPTAESYERLGAFKAPRYVTWSPQNRSQLIRIPADTGEFDRIELRSADCTANPYLAYALIIEAGLDSMRRQLEPPAPVNRNLYELSDEEKSQLKRLPESLGEACGLAESSAFVRSVIPSAAVAALRRRRR